MWLFPSALFLPCPLSTEGTQDDFVIPWPYDLKSTQDFKSKNIIEMSNGDLMIEIMFHKSQSLATINVLWVRFLNKSNSNFTFKKRENHDTLVIWKVMWWHCWRSFPGGAVVKNLPADAGDASDMGSIPGLGRSHGGGNGTPLQYSCLENPWQAIFHRVVKSQTWLRARVRTHTHCWRSGEMSWLFSQEKPAMTQNYPIPCDPGACVHFPCVLPLLARRCISISLLSSVPSFPHHWPPPPNPNLIRLLTFPSTFWSLWSPCILMQIVLGASQVAQW